jgi:hypothetical protein
MTLFYAKLDGSSWRSNDIDDDGDELKYDGKEYL